MLGKRLIPAAVETAAAILLLIITLSACAGKGTGPQETADKTLPVGVAVPFPTDDTAAKAHPSTPHHTSAPEQFIIDGSDFFNAFGQADVVGTTLVLTAQPGSFAAAIYSIDLTGTPLLGADINYSVTGGGQAFYGFADYSKGHWQIEGPQNSNPPDVDLSAGDYTSVGEIFYFFVLAYDGAVVTITNTSVTADAGSGGPPWTLSGKVTDGSSAGIGGITIHIAFQSLSTSTDVDGNYSFTNLADGDYTLVPDNMAATATDSLAFTPDNITVTVNSDTVQNFTAVPITMPATVSYASNMKPWMFEPVCMNCHNSTKTGSERHGAPTFVNWDSYDGTTAPIKTLGNKRVQNGTMPAAALTFLPNTFQKALFQKWADGGFQP